MGGSEEFKRVMEEVKRQREQLLAFHKRQREEEEMMAELEAKKDGSDDEEGSNAEDMQTMEGTLCVHHGICLALQTLFTHTH